jgi:hypothetical protein
MRTACAILFFLTDSELTLWPACAELEFDDVDPPRNGFSELPPVACFMLTVATPERSWRVIVAETLSESSVGPCFTAHIHGLDVLVTSSWPPGQVIQLSHRMLAVKVPSLIPLPLRLNVLDS